MSMTSLTSGVTSQRRRPRSALAAIPTRSMSTLSLNSSNHIVQSVNPLRRRPMTPTLGSCRHLVASAPDDFRRAMVDAVRSGDERRVDLCINGGGSRCGLRRSLAEVTDDRGWPLLCLLVDRAAASPSILRMLVERGGAKVDARVPGTQQTALHLAASRGYQVYVSHLVAAGANVNAIDNGCNTPLMLACRHGHSSSVRLLLQLGAKWTTHSDNSSSRRHRTPTGAWGRETPLHAAAAAGHVDCLRVLVDEFDFGDHLGAVDERGRTALVSAAVNGQLEAATFLVDVLATLNNSNGRSCPAGLDDDDPLTGQTVLQMAVSHGWTSLVVRLLQHRVDIDRRDFHWRTAFSLAVQNNRRDIIPLLVRSGCDTTTTDRAFYTAIHHAARAGHADLIHVLVSTAVDNHKSNLLSPSSSDNLSSDITVNDVNVKAKYGVTPLMLAAHGNHWRTVDELLRLGARPDMVDRHRATALIYALTTVVVNEPCLAIVKTLIRYNASVDEPCNLKSFCNTMDLPCNVIRRDALDDRLYSPIEVAVLRGQLAALTILLQAGCDLSGMRLGPAQITMATDVSCLTSSLVSLSTRRAIMRLVNRIQDVADSASAVKSLQVLCRRPVLDVIVRLANRHRFTISSAISKLPVSDDVRRLLNFAKLDEEFNGLPPLFVDAVHPDRQQLSCLRSPTSKRGSNELIEIHPTSMSDQSVPARRMTNGSSTAINGCNVTTAEQRSPIKASRSTKYSSTHSKSTGFTLGVYIPREINEFNSTNGKHANGHDSTDKAANLTSFDLSSKTLDYDDRSISSYPVDSKGRNPSSSADSFMNIASSKCLAANDDDVPSVFNRIDSKKTSLNTSERQSTFSVRFLLPEVQNEDDEVDHQQTVTGAISTASHSRIPLSTRRLPTTP